MEQHLLPARSFSSSDGVAPATRTPISPTPLVRNGCVPAMPFMLPQYRRRVNVGRTYR